MSTWKDVEADAPDFARRVREVFASGTNKTIATLRADGSPRISGTELEFDGGEVTLGMMAGGVKLRDVRRDPRVAIHSPTVEPPKDPTAWSGEAKLAGRLVAIDPPPDHPNDGSGFFRVDITEVALTRVSETGDRLVIESWHPDRGHRRRTRT